MSLPFKDMNEGNMPDLAFHWQQTFRCTLPRVHSVINAATGAQEDCAAVYNVVSENHMKAGCLPISCASTRARSPCSLLPHAAMKGA